MRLIENKMLQINRYKKVGAYNIYISYRFKSAEAETLLKPQCFAADSSAARYKHQSFAVMRRTGCLFFIVSLISLLLAQSSCINDTSFGAQDGVVNVPLSFALSKAASSTRALSEDQISDFTVLVFNSSGSLVGSNYSSVSGTSSVNVSSPMGSGYTIYGIANTGSSTYFSSVKTLSDFQTLAVSLDPNSGSSLMMFGKLTNVTIGATGITSSSNTKSVNTISLSRLCSKYVFTITPGSGITITGYQLCNLPSNSYIYNGNSSSNPSTTFYNYTVSGTHTEKFTTAPYYMYENLAGTNINSKDEASRNSGNLPTVTTPSFLKVFAQNTGVWESVYYIYLGGVDSSGATDYTDYNVRRNCNYTCTVNINGPGQNDARVSYKNDVPQTPLPNCYIVSPGSTINIPISNVNLFWNSSDAKGSATNAADYIISSIDTWQASIIWQDVSGLVNVTTSTGTGPNSTIALQVPSTASAGNALIGIQKTSGKGTGAYLWSWHIWVTTYNPNATNILYNSNIWMDRNLGATGSTNNDGVNTYGLYYQWGRKDPFKRENPTYVSHDPGSSGNNLALSVNNPATFYDASNRTCDWYGTVSRQTLLQLWSDTKTIYDPCPSGWKVPTITYWNGMNKTSFNLAANGGIYGEIPSMFYPYAGALWAYTGFPTNAGTTGYGYYWSCSSYSATDGCCFILHYQKAIAYTQVEAGNGNNYGREFGFNVRCVKITN